MSGSLVFPQSCGRFIVPSSLPVEKDLTLERVASLQDTYPQTLTWEQGDRDREEGDRDREEGDRDRDSVIIHPELTEL